MRPSRTQLVASALLVLLIAVASAGAVVLSESTARAGRRPPVVTPPVVDPPTTNPPTTTPPTTAPPVTTPPTTIPPVTTPPTTTPPTTVPPTTLPPTPVFGTETPGRWQVKGIASGGAVNVRSAPGTTSPAVATLAHDADGIRSTGKVATLDATLWREVEYRSGRTGWVSAAFLEAHVEKPVFGTEPKGRWDVTGVDAGDKLNVRSGPGTSHKVVFGFGHDTNAIESTGRNAKLGDALWRQVQWNDTGELGWVNARFLKAHAAVPPPVPGTVVMGDWDGNGTETAAVFRDGVWHVWLSHHSGPADLTFEFGAAGDKPVAGDWDGNGTDTPGVFRGGSWHLRNANSSGGADLVFSFGDPGDKPVVGDWDGNGTDTPGVFRGGTWLLRNANSSGSADVVFAYGDPGDKPVAGDWDGNRTDTPGVVRGQRWLLRNANSEGAADLDLSFGAPAGSPVAGDWDGDGDDTPGAVQGFTVHLRNSASSGGTDLAYALPERP